MIVPSSTPGYHTQYAHGHLLEKAADVQGMEALPVQAQALAQLARSEEVRGYLVVLAEYLSDACAVNPKRGRGERSTLWGLQRPPLRHGATVLRAEGTDMDSLLMHLLPFAVSNAGDQVVVSCDEGNGTVLRKLGSVKGLSGLQVVAEGEEEYAERVRGAWNAVECGDGDGVDDGVDDFPLAAHFVSLLFPLGHVTSVAKDDEQFYQGFGASEKWLQMAKE